MSDRRLGDAHLAEVEAEQAALRRIAALLARSVPAEDVFDAVVGEVRSLMRVESVGLVRYEADNTGTYLAVSSEADAPVDVPVYKLPTDGHNVTALVFRTGQPARIDDYTKATGGEYVRRFFEAGVRATVPASTLGYGGASRGLRRAGRKRDRERAGVVRTGSLAHPHHDRRR